MTNIVARGMLSAISCCRCVGYKKSLVMPTTRVFCVKLRNVLWYAFVEVFSSFPFPFAFPFPFPFAFPSPFPFLPRATSCVSNVCVSCT